MDKLAVITKNYKCNFCGILKNDCLKYGPMYKLGNIRAHYYCVLLSNRLIQNGSDNEGILGFLLCDIQKELERTSNITCVYCKKGNATISCAARKCRKSFHLPCGIKGGSLHEFADKFKSFCHIHRPSQNIPPKIYRDACKIVIVCCICFQKVNVKDKINSLWAPCCVRTWYHRLCIQKLAYSSGYFFKCPACNDVHKFNKWMQKFGVFIPQQDASWELVPNAFEDLLYRHDKCDAEVCKCPDGRQKNKDNTVWEIILCESCGSQGIHVACGNLKFLVRGWECPTCRKVTQNLKPKSSDSVEPDEGSSKLSKPTEVCQKKRRRGSEDLKNSVLDKRKKCKISVEEEKTEDQDEIEIDVETVEEELKDKDVSELLVREKDIFNLDVIGKEETKFQEVLAALKPGPLSYKLSLLKKIDQASPSKKKSDQSDTYEIIELIDSDDEYEDNGAKPPKAQALDDIDLIFREELRKRSIEDEFLSFEKAENEDFKSSPEEKITFPFKFLSSKWEVDDQLLILHEIESMNAIIKGVKNYNVISSGFSLPPAEGKNKHHGCSEEEILTQECHFDKSKSDFRKEEDLKAVSDDEVIILTN